MDGRQRITRRCRAAEVNDTGIDQIHILAKQEFPLTKPLPTGVVFQVLNYDIFSDGTPRALLMKYESFDRTEIVHLQGELSAVVPEYHKRNSTLQVSNLGRPIYHMFSIASTVARVSHIDPSESLLALGQSLPDAQASRYAPRLAEWTDMGHQTVYIS